MLHQVGVDTSVYQNTGQIRDHQVSMMDKPISHLWVSIAFKLALLILDKKNHAMFVNTYELYYRLGVLSGNNMDPLWLYSDFYVYRWRSRISLPGWMIHTHWKFTPNPTIMMLSAPPLKSNRGPQQEPGNIPPPDKDAPPKKAQKAMRTTVSVHNRHGCLHAVLSMCCTLPRVHVVCSQTINYNKLHIVGNKIYIDITTPQPSCNLHTLT
jgi:hypothetical protein